MQDVRAIRQILIYGTLLVTAFGGHSFAQTFGGSNPITVSSTLHASAGSNATVSGLTGTVTAITVTLTNLNVTNLNSVGMVLVAPSGEALDVASGICGLTNSQVGNSTFTLADSGTGLLAKPGGSCPANGAAISGTFKPSDFFPSGPNADVFNSPGPATYTAGGNGSGGSGTGTFASTFLGITTANMNGAWKFFIAYQGGTAPSGTLGSWTITFTVSAGTQTTTTLNTGSPSTAFTSVNGTATSVSFQATVNPHPGAGNGTVTFFDGATAIASGVAINASGVATGAATFSTEGDHSITASYSGGTGFGPSPPSNAVIEATNNHASKTVNGDGSVTFCNGPVAISPVNAGVPYPDRLVLGGGEPTVGGVIQKLTVTINGLQSQDPQGLGFALQAPGATTAFEFMSWADGPGTSIGAGFNLTLSDTGAVAMPKDSRASCSSTPCLPTDNFIQIVPSPVNVDSFPSPAPDLNSGNIHQAFPTGSATFASEFGGHGVDGTWNLFLSNRITEGGTTGQISSWCINVTTQLNAHPTTTAVTGTPNPASTSGSATLTATVSSDTTVNAGAVTFVDGSTNIGSANVVNGVATLPNVTLAEGTHHILASYGGTNTGTVFGISSGTFNLRFNNTAGESGVQPYTYCNTGSIAIPGLGADSGVSAPYPSNILVTNLPGTVRATTLTLKQFTTQDENDLLSLVVGPGGNNLDFFSLTGALCSGLPCANTFGPVDLTFDDNGSHGNIVNFDANATGSYKPTSFNTSNTYPACPANAQDCISPPVGPPLPANPFTPTNKATTAGGAILGNATTAGVFGGTIGSTYNGNGTWSLYLDDAVHGAGRNSTIAGGWCVNLTQNLPDISLTSMTHSPAVFTRGQAGSFTVTAHNAGPGSTGIPTLTILSTLPTGLTFTSGSGTGWNCSAVGQAVTCTNATPITAGSDSAVTINFTVGNTTADITSASATSNTAAFPGGTGGDGTPNNNTAASGNITVAGTVLTITKTHTDPFTQGQTGATYSITVHNSGASGANSGPGVTVGTVQVTDALPTNFTLTAVSGTGWTCQPPASGVSCILNAPLAVNSTTNPIVATVTVSASMLGPVTNTGVLTATTDQIGPAGNNQSNDVTNITQVPTQMSTNAGTTPQTATVNTAFPNALAVTVLDAGNHPVANVNVTFTAPGTGASGKFSNNTATIVVPTNASGVAAAPITANTVAGGPYNVSAAATGLTTVNFSLTNNPGAASTMTANAGTTPQTTAVTTAFTNALAVTVKDQFGNLVPNVNVTFTAPGTGASATFSNSTATIVVPTNSSGVASAPVTANATAGPAYTVTAAATGVTTVNFLLTNTAGPATQMTANAGTTPQSAAVNTAFTNALAVTVKDANNNPVSGVNVTFTAPGTGASGTFSNSTTTITVPTSASGVASAPFTANATAGVAYTVTASATGLTTVNFSLTNTAGAATQMTANAGTTPQSATINTAFANALAVTIKDAGNNPVSGVNVTFTAPGTGASGLFSNSLTTIVVPTNASGVASAPFTANGTAGAAYTVTAAATGLTTVNFSLTNTAGSASSMTANAGTTPQSATINTAFTNALAVTVKDAGNNPLSGVNVTFTAPGSGASGLFANSTATITVPTNASGVASAPFTANGTAGAGYTVTAASTGLTTVNFTLTNTTGAASSMTANAGTTPQSATINTAFANALAVTVKDAGSNPISGVNVTFTAPGTGASGLFSNSLTAIVVPTNASGVASAPFTANATAGGAYTVTAAATGLTTVNFSLTNTGGGASSMTANAGTTPQSAPVNTAFTNALAVTVKDAGNNPLSGVNVTFTAPGTGASGLFSNSTTTITVPTNASGVASAPFTANGTAGAYTVTAGSAGLTTVNFSLTNTDTAAVVTSVSSTTANGTYGVGANIVITVTFNKAVNVSGTPLLALNSGGTAAFAGGSGGTVLMFAYAVAAGQTSPHLDATSSSALTLNGGAITNLSGVAASLVLPAPGSAGSLGANTSIVINTAKTTPVITWNTPAPIVFGTALGAAQLNATANVPGTFVYTPPAGTVLLVGNSQLLSVAFTPTDTVTYNNASATTTINVTSAVAGVQILVTKVLSRDVNNNITVLLTLTDNGGSDANNVVLTGVSINGVFGTPRPLSVGTIPVGTSMQATVTVPGTAGVSGAPGSMVVNGTYTGGTVTSNSRVTLP